MAVRYSVPVSSGITPKDRWSPASSGVHFVPNRNSRTGTSPKNATVSRSSESTISTVVRTETAAAASRPYLMACSPTLRRVRVYARDVTLGALLRVLELGLGLAGLRLGERHDLGGLRDVLLIRDHEVHEGLDLGAGDRLRARVHEQRARQRRVGAVLDRLRARLDAAVARVDADQVELVLRALVIGEPEVAQATVVALDPRDELVVVLGRLIVLPGGALLAVDLAREEVERAGVGARAVQRQLRVGQLRVHVGEALDLRALVPDLLELVRREAVQGERLVGDDGDAVIGDLDLAVLDARLVAGGNLFVVLDRPRGVGDVGLAGTELLEAAAGARRAHRDLDVGVLLVEQLGRGLRERRDRRGAVDRDLAAQLAAARAPGGGPSVVAAARSGAEREHRGERGQHRLVGLACHRAFFRCHDVVANVARRRHQPVTDPCLTCEKPVKAAAGTGSRTRSACG